MPIRGVTNSTTAGRVIEWAGVSRTNDPTFYRNTNSIPLVLPSGRGFIARSLTVCPGTPGQPDTYAVVSYRLPYWGWPPGGTGLLATRFEKLGGWEADVHVFANGVEVFGTNMTTGIAGYTNLVHSLRASDTIVIAIGPGGTGGSGARVRLYATLTRAEPPSVYASVTPSIVRLGSNAHFYVSFLGSQPFWVQWRRENVDIAGATNQSLVLSNVQLADAGRYAAVVTNAYGATTSSVLTLIVDASPLIIRQPESTVAPTGDPAWFGVDVQGAPPLSYQWRHEEVDLPGANASTLNLPGTTLADAGFYSVVVSNVFGAVTSAPARLYLGTNFVVGDTASLSNALVQGGYYRFTGDRTVTVGRLAAVRVPVFLDAAGYSVTLSPFSSESLFTVEKGGSLILRNLTLASSGILSYHGGAIRNSGGTLIARACTFQNYRASVGGAVAGSASARFIATDCVFTNNHAVGAGSSGAGGAIDHDGDKLALTNCLFTRDTATLRGGAIVYRAGEAYVVDCVFTGCQAPYGGAIDSLSPGRVTVLGTHFLGNVASNAGGALYLNGDGSLVMRNSLLASNRILGEVIGSGTGGRALGGALFSWMSGEVAATKFIGNIASAGPGRFGGEAEGGAIFCGGSLLVSDCELTGNQALGGEGQTGGPGQGGAIYTGSRLALSGCLLATNLAVGGTGRSNYVPSGLGGNGAGGAVVGATVASNCTLVANRAQGGNGLSSGLGLGGAIHNVYSAQRVVHCTFAGNGAFLDGEVPGSGGATLHVTSGSLSLFGCILADSVGGFHSTGAVVNLGYNLSSDATPALLGQSNSLNHVDPLLGPLADNGGPTRTMALLPGSPALDAIPPAMTTAPLDQRGVARPAGAGGDIGAFELGPPSAPRLSIARSGTAVNIQFHGEAGHVYRLLRSPDLRTWASTDSQSATANGWMEFTIATQGDSPAFYRIATP